MEPPELGAAVSYHSFALLINKRFTEWNFLEVFEFTILINATYEKGNLLFKSFSDTNNINFWHYHFSKQNLE